MQQTTDRQLTKCPRCHEDVLIGWEDCLQCGFVPRTTGFVPAAPWYAGPMGAIAAGVALIALGLVLPWFALTAPFVGTINITGFDTSDGKIIAGGAAIVALLLFGEITEPRRWKRFGLFAILIAMGAALGVDYVDATDRIADLHAEGDGMVHVGISAGFYLTLAGTVLAFIATFLHSNRVIDLDYVSAE